MECDTGIEINIRIEVALDEVIIMRSPLLELKCGIEKRIGCSEI